jgi:hypothetical protein
MNSPLHKQGCGPYNYGSATKMISPLKCWKTHERKPGTVEGAKGSCQHKDPSKRPENKK